MNAGCSAQDAWGKPSRLEHAPAPARHARAGGREHRPGHARADGDTERRPRHTGADGDPEHRLVMPAKAGIQNI